MSLTIPDVCTAVVDRLKAVCPALRQVQFASEFAQLVERGQLPTNLPAAVVFPTAETATPSGSSARINIQHQDVLETVGVALIHRHGGDGRGAAAAAVLHAVRVEVMDALVGWAPTPECGPFGYVRKVLQSADGAIALQLVFQTRWTLRKTS